MKLIMTIYKKILLIICFVLACCLYRLSPYKIDFLGYYSSKIGAHQCNTIFKLKSAKKFYKIIELDLVYDENKKVFDIYHFPDKSTGLYLNEYLEAVKKIDKELFLWFDIKNLKKDNARIICEKITTLLIKYQISKNNVLIESRYPKSLSLFIERKFKASYYLPSLFQLSKDKLDLETLKIKNILEKNPEMAISFSHENYDIIKKQFPDQEKYVWSLVRFVNPYYLRTRSILNDDSVKIVLMGFKPVF